MLTDKQVDKLREAIIGYIKKSTQTKDLEFINRVHSAAFWARGAIRRKIDKPENQNDKQ